MNLSQNSIIFQNKTTFVEFSFNLKIDFDHNAYILTLYFFFFSSSIQKTQKIIKTNLKAFKRSVYFILNT
jgi:hypothetical protein